MITLPETNTKSTCKWMLGRCSFLLGCPIFRGIFVGFWECHLRKMSFVLEKIRCNIQTKNISLPHLIRLFRKPTCLQAKQERVPSYSRGPENLPFESHDPDKLYRYYRVIKCHPLWGVQTMQMYGDFEGFPLSLYLIWVGHIMTPVLHKWDI